MVISHWIDVGWGGRQSPARTWHANMHMLGKSNIVVGLQWKTAKMMSFFIFLVQICFTKLSSVQRAELSQYARYFLL